MTMRRHVPARRVVIVVVATVGLVAAAVVVGRWVQSPTIEYPSSWDPRVSDLVAFVEAHRGHRFDHPVAVSFLSPGEYRRASAGDNAKPTADQRRGAHRDVAEFRALGLINGTPDILRAGRDLSDNGTLAFYDEQRDVVNVRGSEMSIGMKVTLVHELTHALQDQTFDVSAMLGRPGEASTAARSVLEGDATAVEDAYIGSLDPSDRDAYERERARQSDNAEHDLADVPDVLTTLFGLPYALGPSFVELVDAGADGPRLDRIDAVYRRLPDTTAELFDPATYFAHDRPAKVVAPSISGSKDPRTQSLGAGVLFVMLAERIPAATAMNAVDGWRGDSMRSAVTGHSAVCVAIRVHTASRRDARELRAAFDEWHDAMPVPALVKISTDGKADVVARSCDAGAKVNIGTTGRSQEALGLPVLRSQIAAAQVNSGVPRSRALCIGTRVARAIKPADLQATEPTPELRERIQALIADATGRC